MAWEHTFEEVADFVTEHFCLRLKNNWALNLLSVLRILISGNRLQGLVHVSLEGSVRL